jgi:hypothetical protein
MRGYIGLFVLTAAAAAATGCMSDTKKAGNFSYDCSGAGKGWGDCREKADAKCGTNNYTVISGEGGAAPANASGNTEMKRVLVVSCK